MQVESEGFDYRNAVTQLRVSSVLDAFVAAGLIKANPQAEVAKLRTRKRAVLGGILEGLEGGHPFVAAAKRALGLGNEGGQEGEGKREEKAGGLLQRSELASVWEFARVLRLVEEHFREEATAKTFFGNWKSERIAAWHRLLADWRISNLHWADAIMAVRGYATSTVPQLSAAVEDLVQHISATQRRIQQRSAALREKRTAFAAACEDLSVSGLSFEDDLREFARRHLPVAFQAFLDRLRRQPFPGALDYFDAFLRASSPGFTTCLFPQLRHFLNLPSTTSISSTSISSTPTHSLDEGDFDFNFEIVDEGTSQGPSSTTESSTSAIDLFLSNKQLLVHELLMLGNFFEQRQQDLVPDTGHGDFLACPLPEAFNDRGRVSSCAVAVSEARALLELPRTTHCMEILRSDRCLKRLASSLRQQRAIIAGDEESVAQLEATLQSLHQQLATQMAELASTREHLRQLMKDLAAEIGATRFEGGKVVFTGPKLLAELQD